MGPEAAGDLWKDVHTLRGKGHGGVRGLDYYI